MQLGLHTAKTIGKLREEDAPGRIFRTKAIRVLSLAPSLDNTDSEIADKEMKAEGAKKPQDVLQELLMMFNDEDEEGGTIWGVGDASAFEEEWIDESDGE